MKITPSLCNLHLSYYGFHEQEYYSCSECCGFLIYFFLINQTKKNPTNIRKKKIICAQLLFTLAYVLILD